MKTALIRILLLALGSFAYGETRSGDQFQQMAAIDLELGKFSEGLDCIEKALEEYGAQESPSIETRLNLVDSHILKGRLLGCLKRYPEAAEEILSVFEENWAIRGEQHIETTRLYKHIGWHLGRLAKKGGTLQDLKNGYRDAEEPLLAWVQNYYEKALAADVKAFGEMHPETAKDYSLLGWMLGDQGRYSEALEFHFKALAIRVACNTELHPDVARSYSNIGWNYEQLGDYTEALNYYTTSLRIKEQVFPQGHPDIEEVIENICRVENALQISVNIR